jgi:hypothetical protein
MMLPIRHCLQARKPLPIGVHQNRSRRINIVSLTTRIPFFILLAATVAGCARDGDFDQTGGVMTTRSACPAVAIPAHTGDITVFNPPSSREARAIDVVANVTNLRSTCNEAAGDQIVVKATFDVQARRSNADGARDMTVPYFATVVQGGRAVVSKRISNVTLRFEPGQLRATASGEGTAVVNRAAVTLPPEILQRVTRKRRPGDADAALDPLADPEVRAAVTRASFELLIGFQLTQDQLQYNATR